MPRIWHLPGSQLHDDDLLLDEEGARPFFTEKCRVTEKTDGIAITIKLNAFGEVEAGFKASWKRALGGSVERAANLWVCLHEAALVPLLRDGSELLGEWMWHRLTLPYRNLPSEVVFHARLAPDGRLARFEPANGLRGSPSLFEGRLGKKPIASLVRRSQWSSALAEGVIVELDTPAGLRWAKWVRPGYHQPKPDELTGELNHVNDGS